MSEVRSAARRFTLDQANALLPLVRQVTDEAVREVEEITRPLPDGREPRAEKVEKALNGAIARWRQQIEDLGVEAKGLWLVDFDNGDGYYCWQFPERAVTHYHGYTEGFAGRMKIV